MKFVMERGLGRQTLVKEKNAQISERKRVKIFTAKLSII